MKFLYFYCIITSISVLHCFSQNDTIRDSNIKLNEITVVADSKLPLTGMSSGNLKIDPQALQTLPSTSGSIDLLKILELTPSVRTAGDANSNLYVRGGDPGQNLILYNGTPCYTPGHILGFFPAV